VTAGRGRCAAQNQKKEAASPPLTFTRRAAAPGAGGRAARGYGAAPPASRLLRTAARRPAAGLDPGDLCGPSGRKYGQAPACPGPGAARPVVTGPPHQRTPGQRSELVFDSQKKKRNYKNPLTRSVHTSRGLPVRSYLDSAASHGLTALGAITTALNGKPWLPLPAIEIAA